MGGDDYYITKNGVCFASANEAARVLENEVAQLKGAIQLGQANCDDVYNDLKRERDVAKSKAYIANEDATKLRAELAKVTAERDEAQIDRDSLAAKLANLAKERAEVTDEYLTLRARVAELEGKIIGQEEQLKAITNTKCGFGGYLDEIHNEQTRLEQRNAELVAALRGAVKWLIMIDERRSDVPQWLRHDADPRPLRKHIEQLLKAARAESATPAKPANTMTIHRQTFFDKARNREMCLESGGEWDGWLFWKHEDGMWVSLRKATEADRAAIDAARGKDGSA